MKQCHLSFYLPDGGKIVSSLLCLSASLQFFLFESFFFSAISSRLLAPRLRVSLQVEERSKKKILPATMAIISHR